jgi:hypothetical protein
MRPMCLNNLLNSIKIYEDKYQKQFDQIIIVDDSDDKNKQENQSIINEFPKLNIEYYGFDFDSVAVSKGRNIAISHVMSDYFILCDDDTLFNLDCDIEANLQLLKDKNLDILGGYYRDITAIDDTSYKPTNWLGFIQECENFDICTIIGDEVFEYCTCDIVQNFFIAKTETVKQVKYPEEVPVLEHQIYFLLAKQHHLKVAHTSNLFINHLHIESKSKTKSPYFKYRNRTVINPINKKLIGILYTKKQIIKFSDYLLNDRDCLYEEITKEKFSFKKFIKNIFYVGNEWNKGELYKIIKILGFKFRLYKQ